MNEPTAPAHPGSSRSSVHRDHALITPESHVPVTLPGWTDTETVVLVSGELGARFSQFLLRCGSRARLQPPDPADELFFLVLDGQITAHAAGATWPLAAGDYVYLPPERAWHLAGGPAELLAFRKRYVPAPGTAPPAAFRRALADVPAEPFLGDDGALLQTLLPADTAFDWGINVFEFAPGGTLPQVESHFMEHGLYLLQGQGVYRLGEHWYPVQQGDCIWMAPYLLQWYVAAGKTPSRYIYYKDMNRAPLG